MVMVGVVILVEKVVCGRDEVVEVIVLMVR